jgi:predicted alpha/beta superfamily hydrolase
VSQKLDSRVSIANTRRLPLRSRINGRRYELSVALPVRTEPGRAHGVLYLLDSHAYFGSAVEAVRSSTRSVIVVGIGYPRDATWSRAVLTRHSPLPKWLTEIPHASAACTLERRYDLTLPVSQHVLDTERPAMLFDPKSDRVGGLESFLEVIETEIKPQVSAETIIDPRNQAIFGHSLGGLAVVHALFTRPHAFRTFIAASPSLWWGNRAVLAGEARFAAAVRAGKIGPKVLITAGAAEEDSRPSRASSAIDPKEHRRHIKKARMVSNARELAARLRALKGTGSYEVAECAIFEDVGHTLAPWPALARAVDFAFGDAE